MALIDLLKSPSIKLSDFPPLKEDEILFSQVSLFHKLDNQSLSDFQVAILGVPEDRNSLLNQGTGEAPDFIRSHLYKLSKVYPEPKIVDLGNIVGGTAEESYYNLYEVLETLYQLGLPVVVLGGSSEIFTTIVEALPRDPARQVITLVDALCDFQSQPEEINEYNYLGRLFFKESQNYDCNLLGLQKYYLSSSQEEFLNNNFIDFVRLKDLRDNKIVNIEPYTRESVVVGFDVCAIQSSFMQGHSTARPNGFTALDACQIGWYSGCSEKIKSFGLFEFNPKFDNRGEGNHLLAQVIWHFILGIVNKSSFLLKDVISIKKFNVHLKSFDLSLDFFNSNDGLKWWMEVRDVEGSKLVSCSYDDYSEALNGEVPRKWWRYFQRSQSSVK